MTFSNELSSVNPQPATDGNNLSQPSNITCPELRGELNHDGDSIAERDRRFGVPVPIGAIVLTAEGVGRIIGGTDELAIIVDAKGKQYAQRWGVIHVQASGPAFNSSASNTGYSFHTLDPDAVERVVRDPFREAAMRVTDCAKMVDELEVECDNLIDDHTAVFELLRDAVFKLNEIATNRADRLLGLGPAIEPKGGAA